MCQISEFPHPQWCEAVTEGIHDGQAVIASLDEYLDHVLEDGMSQDRLSHRWPPRFLMLVIPNVGSSIGLGEADLRQVVYNLLNLVLSFLPLVALTMIMIGGFLWLTSGGNDERIDQAKRTISSAIIGMVIVLLAWAIVYFFAQTTANVTQA